MKRRLISLVIAAIFCCGLSTTTFAVGQKENHQEADYLFCLGLLQGKETDEYGNPQYDLEGSLTREEALVMLIRLLGQEKEATTGELKHPFMDVSPWVSGYVGYAYENGITKGIDKSNFGGDEKSTSAQFVTFMLRALGYSDKEGDFKWNNPFALSNRIGLTPLDEKGKGTLTRGDAVKIAYTALSRTINGTRRTLKNTLELRGDIPKGQVICIPMDSISLAEGETAWIWVMQSERYAPVSMWADWTNGEVAELVWEGDWYNKNCTGFYLKGKTPGTSVITVTYENGGSETVMDNVTVQVY